ncbi:MAG: PEP-CTERM system TPR-repeat protein PrsT [Thiobacillus sp.]|uniref:XrtA/PEP-CTERM system TPR-repeat protein PrsT n=1 Tax=Thiobacillus sp. TaxID=924 RepID=UPI0028954D05|nr:XrtA/PEP-CTERM system TPR-repeat protein PrsT [Thiobacillus sp.]MDT3706972.1 PEP-CTERM system TPR-repeat protein PrsT [Thiobacillus sp.]
MNPHRRHSHKATVVALTLALALAACGESPEQHLQMAQERLQKSDYKTAVIELKTVLQAQPDNREARLLLGETFIRSEAYPNAEKELSKARSLGVPDDRVLPALAKVHVRMGEPQKTLELGIPATGLSASSLAALHIARAEAQLALGNRAEAEQSIVAAKQAAPKSPELLLTQAKWAFTGGQKEQAAQLVDEALQGDPRFNEARYLKAALLETENKPDDAAKLYQQILADDPSQLRAHLAIAGLQLKKGDIEATDRAIQMAEKVAGKTPLVMYARGTLELQRGNPNKASNALMEVLRVVPDHLPSMLAYAMASYSLGNYEQSITYSNKVLAVAPDNLNAAKLLADSLLMTGDANGALKTLAPILPRYPDDAKLMALAGKAYLQTRDYSKAMDYLERAAELDPKDAAIRTRLAAGHLAGGESDKALTDLETATTLSGKPSQADVALAILLLKGKEYDRALQVIANLEKKLPENPITHNLRAAVLLDKGDRAGARKALEQALAIDPKFYLAAVNLARLDMLEQKPEAARKRFDSILAADKNNVKAMMALADLAMAEKREKDYVKWLEKASKADPKAMEPRSALVRYYLKNKENQKALNLAQDTANNANADSLAAMGLLGSVQMATGDNAAAIETFNSLTLKAPRSPDAYLRLALAQIADKKLDPARDSLKKAIRIKPDFLQAHDTLIGLELADKKPGAALQIAREIQAQQPKSPFGFEREADILLSQKQFPQAAKAYEQAMTKQPSSAMLIKLHRALFLSGDDKSAEQRFNAWLKRNPKDVSARAYAAEFYMETQRDRDAIAQYEDLLKLAPRNALALNNLANLYQRAKDGRALSVAENAYKLAPDHPGVQDTLGWILAEQGQLPRAIELLGKAAAKMPRTGSVRYHYGVALVRVGQKTKAKKELEAAIATDRNFPEAEAAKAMLSTL